MDGFLHLHRPAFQSDPHEQTSPSQQLANAAGESLTQVSPQRAHHSRLRTERHSVKPTLFQSENLFIAVFIRFCNQKQGFRKSPVRLSVRLSVTLMYRGRIDWVSSKVITTVISLGSSLIGAPTSAI